MESQTKLVGQNVAAAIAAADLNPNLIAQATGIPYTTLNRHINGHGGGFTVGHLETLADHLDVDVVTFFTPVKVIL